MPVIDQFHDPVMASLVRIVAQRPKLASAVMNFDVDPAEQESLPDDAFAWPEKRAFPIHSREHAALSRAYRLGVGGPVPSHVDVAIKEACMVYGVPESLFDVVKTAAAPPPDDDFLLPDMRRLRVTQAQDVKVAEERLATEGGRLAPGHRLLAGARLVEKAASLGVKVGSVTRRMAGLVATDTGPMADWLEARGEAAPLAHKEGYFKLAAEVRRLPAELRDRDVQVRIAAAIEELDMLSGLSTHWDRRLPDPLVTVFNTDKTAGAGAVLAGQFVPIERMAAYPSEFYADVLGPDIMREAADASGQLDVHKLASVLATLPVDMQRALVHCMG